MKPVTVTLLILSMLAFATAEADEGLIEIENEAGLPVYSEDASGSVLVWEYDWVNGIVRVTDQDGVVTEFEME